MDETGFAGGDVAWVLTACALVLMMTVPGLALFYGGMVRRNNVLATLMQALTAAVLVTLVTLAWVIAGYSIAFGGEGAFYGGFSRIGLSGLSLESASGALPESVFILFQLTFAIITVAIIAGAGAERMSFKAWMIFTPIWLLIVYAPIAHWVWGEGFLYDAGVLLAVRSFSAYPLEGPVLTAMAFNPVDLARVVLLLEFDLSAMLGYTGALFEQVFGTALGLGLALGLLLLWTAAPAWMGGRAFRAKDF